MKLNFLNHYKMKNFMYDMNFKIKDYELFLLMKNTNEYHRLLQQRGKVGIMKKEKPSRIILDN